MKLIINSDDFGLSEGINRAVLRGFREGYLTSATLMVNQGATSQALEMWRDNRETFRVGLHFCLDSGKPLSTHKEFCDNEGNFKKPHSYLKDIPVKIIIDELLHQIRKAESLGCEITHIDSHHHIHLLYDNVREAVEKVAGDLHLPVRRESHLISKFYGNQASEETIGEEIRSFLDKGLEYVDIMCHISEEDPGLHLLSSYSEPRIGENRLLRDLHRKGFFQQPEISLASYRDIHFF